MGMTDAEVVADLRAMAARYDMTATARYEADAEAFYRETGFMAPGKDVPMAMGGQDEGERRAAYEQWVGARGANQQAGILRGAEAIEEVARLREALENFALWLDTPVWRRRMRDIGGNTEEFYAAAIEQARAALSAGERKER
jgi:hypothetical protein